jgi:hypothetical protein
LDSKKLNWFKLVDDVTYFFLSADGLGHCPTVTSLVTASSGVRSKDPAPPGSEAHSNALTAPESEGHLEVPTSPRSGGHLEVPISAGSKSIYKARSFFLGGAGSDVGCDLGSGVWDRIGLSVRFYRGTALS